MALAINKVAGQQMQTHCSLSVSGPHSVSQSQCETANPIVGMNNATAAIIARNREYLVGRDFTLILLSAPIIRKYRTTGPVDLPPRDRLPLFVELQWLADFGFVNAFGVLLDFRLNV